MTAAAKLYRLPCRCSAEVVVGPGQAGGRVACPACGGAIDVPRLSDLAGFAVSETPTATRRWRACQGWFLLGTATALGAAVAAVFIGSGGFSSGPRLDAEAIRATVESADAATIYRAWRAIRSLGVDRGAFPEEVRIRQLAGVSRMVSRLLWMLALVGGLAATVAAVRCLAGGRAPAIPPPSREAAS